MFNLAPALFCLLSFSWLSFVQGASSIQNSSASTIDSVSASGFKINLNYQNLVATITRSKEKLVLYDWADIAEAVVTDATSEPFGSAGTAPRYDLWPILTTDVYDIPESPSFTIRFSLIPAPGCPTRLIDKGLLTAVAGMLQQFPTVPGGLNVEFTGTIDLQNTALYEFRLINVNRDVAESYRTQESITSEDAAALRKGRDSIISQTVKNDLLLFTGPLGALLYYTINQQADTEDIKRNAWLVPADFPRQWSQRQHLDVLKAHPFEYASYKRNVLKPAFDSFRRRMIGKSRVIIIGHWGVDFLTPNLRDVIVDLRLFSGPFYSICIYGEGETPPATTKWSFNPLYPINIGTKEERRRMSGRNVPTVVPFYPYYYWDVPYNSVPWADEAYGKKVAEYIRTGQGPSLSLPPVVNSTDEPLQVTSRSIKQDERQRQQRQQRLHARQLQGTNATVPIPKPPTAPDDDTTDKDPLYGENLLASPNLVSQACVPGEPAVLDDGSDAANSTATGSQSPAAGVDPDPVNGAAPVGGGVAATT